jgi:hypothetical protein
MGGEYQNKAVYFPPGNYQVQSPTMVASLHVPSHRRLMAKEWIVDVSGAAGGPVNGSYECR